MNSLFRRKTKPVVLLDENASPSSNLIDPNDNQRPVRPKQWRPRFLRTTKRSTTALILFCILSLCLLVNTVHAVLYADELDGWWWWGRRRRSEVREGVRAPPPDPLLQRLLGGVHHRRTPLTKEERLTAYDNLSIVYTYLDPQDPDYRLRRAMMRVCAAAIQAAERDRLSAPAKDTPCRLRKRTLAELEAAVGVGSAAYDEIRYSLRSLEAHVPWHRGALVVVVPSTRPPDWLNRSKHFFAGRCETAVAGAHRRLVWVHQHCLLPRGFRLTANTNTVEKYLWRVHHLTPIHLHFNDDFFVNRRVEVTDWINPYGGPYVRLESAVIPVAQRTETVSHDWYRSVAFTTLFTTYELDLRPQGTVSNATLQLWSEAGTPRVDPSHYLEWSDTHSPDPLPLFLDLAEGKGRWRRWMKYWFPQYQGRQGALQRALAQSAHRPRYFAAHAPFVYCTGMLQYLERRFTLEYLQSRSSLTRGSSDLVIPFVYNAFMAERPWEASPRFLDALFSLHVLGKKEGEGLERPIIELDNYDGCAPSVELIGPKESQSMFIQFTDNFHLNRQHMDAIKTENPLFFNMNNDFKEKAVGQQMMEFLKSKFTKPFYLERHEEEGEGEGEDDGVYASLMQLPVVILVSYEEAVCGAVRSLQLALPDHKGVVRVFHPAGREGSLQYRRELHHHHTCSAMPAVRCAWRSGKVTVEAIHHLGHDTVVHSLLENTLNSINRAPVELPLSCGSMMAGKAVKGLVLDLRSPVQQRRNLPKALRVPGQLLTLEDFEGREVSPTLRVLYLTVSPSRKGSSLHWIEGGCSGDLLEAFPLPYRLYESYTQEEDLLTWDSV